MSKQPDNGGWPSRLQDQDREVGQILRKYSRHLDAGDDEPAAFARMRVTPRRLAPRMVAVAGVLAAAGLVIAWLGTQGSGEVAQRAPEGAVNSQITPAPPVSAPTPTPTPALTPQPTLRLTAQSVALPPGRTDLHQEATITLAEGTKASARAERGESTISVETGSVELHVDPRPPGRSFVVKAGSINFVVVGTAFRVSRQQSRVTLEVSEGRVAVVRGGEKLALITAGGSWTGQADELPPGRPAARRANNARTTTETSSAASLASTGCAALVTAGRVREAIACLEQRGAQGSGPDSDVAAYEAARLWKEEAHDLERARAGFEAYRRRFPHGALRVEAALSLLEILPRVGRHQEALAEAAWLLANPDARLRQAEVHLVRGNIFRLALGDRAAAADEYRAAAAGSGPAADEGAYLYAVCLQELGRRLEARDAFDLYLERGDARHNAEASRRRNVLSR